MDTEHKYDFSWDLLGDIGLGRPNLGAQTRLEVYRLMQFSLRSVLEQRLGTEETDRVFYEAGRLAGLAFYQQYLSHFSTFGDFANGLQAIYKA